MNMLFMINTEAQLHFWKNIIKVLSKRDDNYIGILVRDYGHTLELASGYGLHYDYFKPTTIGWLRYADIIKHVYNCCKLAKEINPDVIIGFGVDAASTSALLRKPCIVFTDSEPIPVQHFLTKLFASVILTPSCFKKDLGKKQVRLTGYKELAYLHPDYFRPDPSIYNELGINKDDKYVILRFNAFDAVHDIGKHGFTVDNQIQLVKELEEYAYIFISPESSLPKQLEKYRLPIPNDRIHHALHYAQLLVSDTQTMTTEAAILGTPAIRCNSFVGHNDMGNFIELEQKYDLLYSFRESDRAIQKALELLQQPDLKDRWAKKRQKLLADKIDVTQFMIDFIENYPESFHKY